VSASVTKVGDGDTIQVRIEGTIYELRYIGINCPEAGSGSVNDSELANRATDKNRELVLGKTVELEKDVSETDRYDRLLRYVYVDGVMVNTELVRLGLARSVSYPPDTRHQGLLSSAQAEAKAARLGIWAMQASEAAPPTAAKGIYVGSKKSNKYHDPACKWGGQIASYNEIWFSSSEDARAKGYIPCKGCQPP
jgi:endonuclease YncB( thermonuclease family)